MTLPSSERQFYKFAEAVDARFKEMSINPLFIVNSERDVIWDKYLQSFPAGSNPVFREKTEHDCSCCRNFVRSIGNVVAIQNGAMVSVWDLNGLPEPYQTVADAMSRYIKSLPIRDVFYTIFASVGQRNSRERIGDVVHTWNHFQVDVDRQFITRDIDEKQGHARTSFQVLRRSILELSPEAVNTVVELIEGENLYRGTEHKKTVQDFKRLQDRVLSIDSKDNRNLEIWNNVKSSVCRFRNTVIGTLVQDLTEGVDLERAVRSFETKVAPANYKRPKSLITPAMVKSAMGTIEELGLEDSLQRRHARFSDISVNDVLFVDNSRVGQMKGGVESLLMEQAVSKTPDLKNGQDMSWEEFKKTIIPQATSLELHVTNDLVPSFVSLTAPVHEDAPSLFTWGNNFAWSYDGNVTDSIKEKVKRAGGQVENNALRVSLAWYNFDDLDIHVDCPDGHIHFGNKRGILDIDMNAGSGSSREAVENLRWGSLKDGKYEVWVNQYNKRESIDVGFEIEVETDGELKNYNYEKPTVTGKNVNVLTIQVKKGQVVSITPASHMKGGSTSREHWGVNTNQLVKVDSVIRSPNYWGDEPHGNEHVFFIIDGCLNPDPTRGIYNEFLRNDLTKHRKVFEILGDKTKCPYDPEQMSGIGISTTRKEKTVILASGPKMKKVCNIVF